MRSVLCLLLLSVVIEVVLCKRSTTALLSSTLSDKLECGWRSIESCSHLYLLGVNETGGYEIFGRAKTFCDMSTEGGRWTMCYTQDDQSFVAIDKERVSSVEHPTPGYRSDCTNVPFSEIMYISGTSKALFRNTRNQTYTLSTLGYNTLGNDTSWFTSFGSSVADDLTYQLVVCGQSYTSAGLVISKYDGCVKTCNDMCLDTSASYYRTRSTIHQGVAFKENTYAASLPSKTMSVAVRDNFDNFKIGDFVYYQQALSGTRQDLCLNQTSTVFIGAVICGINENTGAANVINIMIVVPKNHTSTCLTNPMLEYDQTERVFKFYPKYANITHIDSTCSNVPFGVACKPSLWASTHDTWIQNNLNSFSRSLDSFSCNVSMAVSLQRLSRSYKSFVFDIINDARRVNSTHILCYLPMIPANRYMELSVMKNGITTTKHLKLLRNYTCYGVESTNSAVCGGRGVCSDDGLCFCYTGYAGDNCSSVLCSGIPSTSNLVCNSHGACVSPNVCSCLAGWSGNLCSIPQCYGITATNSTVCSGYGSCVGLNNCSCTSGYRGNNCQFEILPLPMQVANFDGGNYFLVHNSYLLNFGSTYSLEFWIMFTSVKNKQAILGSRTGMIVLDSFKVVVQFYESAMAGWKGFSSSNDLFTPVANTWYHFVASVAHDSGKYEFSYIINGKHYYTTGLLNSLGPTNVMSEKNFFIAKNDIPSFQNFEGYVTQLRVWKRKFTLAEANGLMCSNTTGSLANEWLTSNSTRCSITNHYLQPYNDPQFISRSVIASVNSISFICDGCPSSYSGANCAAAFCFGVSANNASVCAGHGTCLSVDTCDCQTNYFGAQCHQTFCFGNDSQSPSVCSGHGECRSFDTCTCSPNWKGTYCNITTCSNIDSTSSSVCNGRGKCTSFNSCTCNQGWVGSFCTVARCFGSLSNESRACSGHGACTSPNNCVCQATFSDVDCSIKRFRNAQYKYYPTLLNYTEAVKVCRTDFQGKIANIMSLEENDMVYSLRTPGAYESMFIGGVEHNLFYPRIFLWDYNDLLPMSFTRWRYAEPNYPGDEGCIEMAPSIYEDNVWNDVSCSSKSAFVCKRHFCSGFSFLNESICTGNRTCDLSGECRCKSFYSGSNCDVHMCNQVNYTSPNVCSGHGTCLEGDVCECEMNYTGRYCQLTTCYGTRNDNGLVCSSHGTCMSYNNCSCLTGYVGDRCQTPVCFGTVSTNNQVCNGHGTCTSPDICYCNYHYSGPSCSNYLHCNGIDSGSYRAQASGSIQVPYISAYNYNDSFAIEIFVFISEMPANHITHTILSSGNCITEPMGVSLKSSTLYCTYNNISVGYVVQSGFHSIICRIEARNTLQLYLNNILVAQAFLLFPTSTFNISTFSFGKANCASSLVAPFKGELDEIRFWKDIPVSAIFRYDITSVILGDEQGLVALWRFNQTARDFTSNGNNGTMIGGTWAFNVRNSRSCSGNGACQVNSFCACDSQYTGAKCDVPRCFGFDATSSEVCHRKGLCTAPDTCECNPGFSDSRCMTFTTRDYEYKYYSNAVNYTSAAVGCIRDFGGKLTNMLTHTELSVLSLLSNYQEHWIGLNDIATEGVFVWEYDGSVPSPPMFWSGPPDNYNNEDCVFTRTTGYWNDASCSLFRPYICKRHFCNRLPFMNPASCGTNATCTAPDQCTCKPGYNGRNCDIHMCFGVNYTSGGVCSFHGKCIAPDTCDCNDGWTGPFCNVSSCFSISSTSSHVCSSHGLCVGPNNCSCLTNYVGKVCEHSLCFGFVSNTSSVCSGHGTCLSPNNCSCVSGYTGSNCQNNACFGIQSNSSNVCNGRGICTGANTCQCNKDYEGRECECILPRIQVNSWKLTNTFFGSSQTWSGLPPPMNTQYYVSSSLNCLIVHAIIHDASKYPFQYVSQYRIVVNGTNEIAVTSSLADKNITMRNNVLLTGFIRNAPVGRADIVVQYRTTGYEVWNPSFEVNYERQLIVEAYPCSVFASSRENNIVIPNGLEFMPILNTSFVFNSSGIARATVELGGAYSMVAQNCSLSFMTLIKDSPMFSFTRVGTKKQVSYNGFWTHDTSNQLLQVHTANNGCNRTIEIEQDLKTILVSYPCFNNVYTYSTNQSFTTSTLHEWEIIAHIQLNITYTFSDVLVMCDVHPFDAFSPYAFRVKLGNNSLAYTYGGISVNNSHGVSLRGVASDISFGLHNLTLQAKGILVIHNPQSTIRLFAVAYRSHRCYGLQPDNPMVCSNRGTCASYNTCVCKVGYTGMSCEYRTCFGIASVHDDVCGGHGVCVDVDKCECNASFIGKNCTIPKCTACGNGTCLGSLSFDGSSTFLYNTSPYNVHTSTGRGVFSFLLWFYPRNVSTTMTLFAKWNHGVWTEYFASVIPPGKVQIARGSMSYNLATPDNTISVNNWHHFAMTYDGSLLKLYINGSLMSSAAVSNTVNRTDVALHIGTILNNWQRTHYFNGFISDFAVYNTSLSAKQVYDKMRIAGYEYDRDNVMYLDFLEQYDNPRTQIRDKRGLHVTFENVHTLFSFAAPYKCKCPPYVFGESCSIYECFGKLSYEQQVCSGHGACNLPNQCNCSLGYSSSDCSLFSCFDIMNVNSSVCSAHGNCIDKDICACNSTYTGQTCHVPLCYGISASNSSVCSTHGVCFSPNNCSCTHGYTGSSCSIPICFGFEQDSASACSSHGFCHSPDYCACNTNWTGSICNIPLCFGVRANDTAVCSGHGTCGSANSCSCNPGYYGDNCQHYDCFGVQFQSVSVCSANGTCVAPNSCNCRAGFTGVDCNIPMCYGISSTEYSSCSGHGRCIFKDTCLCNQSIETGFWGAHNCSSCREDYKGLDCKEQRCNAFATCSSHGVCNSDYTCSCFADEVRGYWAGPNCAFCADNYDGAQCNLFCEPLLKCSGHGTCSRGMCKCYASVTQGFFASENCSVCSPNWFGSDCRTTFTSTTNISFGGNVLVTNYYVPEATSWSCNNIFDSESLRKLGMNPKCYWPFSNETFYVEMDSFATIVPGDVVKMHVGARSARATTFVSVQVGLSTNVRFDITAIAKAHSIGSCDDLVLDATSSYSSDGRKLSYFWQLRNDSCGDNFENLFHHQQRNEIVQIPADLVPFGNHTFALTIFNSFNASNTVTVTAVKFPASVPSPLIRGAAEQVVFSSDYVTLEGGFPPGNCEASDLTMIYHWKQTRGPTILMRKNYNSHVFPPFTFIRYASPAIYSFELMLSQYVVFSRTASVTFVVKPQDLRAVLIAPSIISFTQNLVLDARQSSDPERMNSTATYLWSCFNDILKVNCSLNINTYNKTLITIPRNYLSPSTYTFTIRFIKDERVAITRRQVRVIDDIPPTLIFNPIPAVLPANRKIVLSITRIESNVQYLWSCVPAIALSQVLNSVVMPVLSIRENTFLPGTAVTCALNATKFNVTATASVSFTIASPPMPGELNILPMQGLALQTPFKIIVSRFTGAAPFRYTFGYLDPVMNNTITLSSFDTSNTITTQLPLGNVHKNYTVTVFVRVQDTYGAETILYDSVTSTPPQGQNTLLNLADRISQRIAAQLEVKDISEALTIAASLQSTFTNLIRNDELTTTRELILNKLAITSQHQQEIFTPKYITQTANVLMSFSSPVLSIDTKHNVLNVISGLLNSTSAASISSSIAMTLSNLVLKNATSDLSYSKIILRQSELLAKQVSSSMQPGEQPIIINTPNIQFISKKDYPSNIAENKIVQRSIEAEFPSAITSVLSADDPVNLFINVFAFNPYVNSNANVTSSILSMSLSMDTIPILVSNLSSPIVFTIMANHTAEEVRNFINGSGYIPSCYYWNSTAWSEDGCSTVNVTMTNITCACNHLTDFAAVLKYVTPKLNVLTVDDLNLVGKVDSSNFVVVIAICSLSLVYLVILLLLCICKCQAACTMNTSMASTRLRAWVNVYVKSHTWLATIFLPEESAHFTRSQRVTVLFCGILGAFCGNALTSETQDNFVQSVAAMVISDLISLPFVIMMTYLFQKTATRRRTKEVYAESVFSKLVNSTSTSISNSPTSSQNNSPRLYTKKERALNLLREIGTKLDSLITKLETIAANTMSDNRFVVVFLCLLSAGYLSALACILFILIRAHPSLLSSTGTQFTLYGIGIVGVDAYFILLLVVYLSVRSRLYKQGYLDRWDIPPKYTALVSGIGIVVITIICGICVAIYASLQVHVYHFTSMLGGVGILMVLLIILLVSLNLKRSKPNPMQKPSIIYTLYRKINKWQFPWWTFTVWYLLCFAYIGVLTYLLVSYGIKFTVQKSKEWMTSSFSGLALNVFITNPVKLLAKLVLFQLTFTLIEWLLKPAGYKPKPKTKRIAKNQVMPEGASPQPSAYVEKPEKRVNTYEQLLQTCIDDNEWQQADDYVKVLVIPDLKSMESDESDSLTTICYSFYSMYITSLVLDKKYEEAYEKAQTLQELFSVRDSTDDILQDVQFYYHACKSFMVKDDDSFAKAIASLSSLQLVDKQFVALFINQAEAHAKEKQLANMLIPIYAYKEVINN